MFEMDHGKVCYIIVRAREFEVQEGVVEPDYGSNATDDDFRQVLEAYDQDPTFDELVSVIDDLNVDEQCELVALAWTGRGDYSKAEWDEALQTARDNHDPSTTATYLLGMPLLPDFLEEGLATFDISCEDVEAERL